MTNVSTNTPNSEPQQEPPRPIVYNLVANDLVVDFAAAKAELAERRRREAEANAKARDFNDILRDEGPDAVREAFDNNVLPPTVINGEPVEARSDQATRPAAPRVLSKAEFLADFVPPDYLIDGMLQRRFIYSLTGQTSHAKTAVALRIARLVSAADVMTLGPHAVERGRVLYFVGENPDDVCIRIIGADALREDDPSTDRFAFVRGVFSIGETFPAVEKQVGARLGGVDLVIVDTSAAYFLGQDENANPQMGAHARTLRKLTDLPGGPCVLVLCHPIKHASEPEQLLPRGGGAFLAEMDGNLTVWKHDDDLVTLSYTKMRGPGFEPLTFRIEPITTTKLVDAKGRMIPTVQVVMATESDEANAAQLARDDQDRLLAALANDATRSVADLARTLGWVSSVTKEPQKSKTQRALVALSGARLVKKYRGRWVPTEAGRKAVAGDDGGDSAATKPQPFKADIGEPLPDVECVQCGKPFEVFKIKTAGVKQQREALHKRCAEAWFRPDFGIIQPGQK